MPTIFYEAQGPPPVEFLEHRVQESVEDVTNAVNAALAANLKYVTFTHVGDGKQFSVAAEDVQGIRDE